MPSEAAVRRRIRRAPLAPPELGRCVQPYGPLQVAAAVECCPHRSIAKVVQSTAITV